uniref:Caspase family p20 domain-containing protein n=1 Tax=Plectus sambesii TaxID=2011161 RepID=A0A914X7E7_9BILA
MVNAPVTGTVNFGDSNDNSQKIDNTGNLTHVSGSGQVSVGGNITQTSGASRGGDSQANQSKEDQERKKVFDGFFKKYLSKDARQKLPGKPYNIKTGKMLIINNEEWPKDLRINGQDVNLNGETNRDGTTIDRDALKELSKNIGFGEAEVKENRTVQVRSFVNIWKAI